MHHLRRGTSKSEWTDRERRLRSTRSVTLCVLQSSQTGCPLEAGARLQSWLDMTTRRGVARGTERLADGFPAVSAGVVGTRVAQKLAECPQPPKAEIKRALQGIARGYYRATAEQSSIWKQLTICGFRAELGLGLS